MANRERGEVSVVVTRAGEEDRRYTLRPHLNYLAELEDRTGKTIADIQAAAGRGSVSAMRQIVWAALQHYHGTEVKTFADAGNWITAAGGLLVIAKALQDMQAAQTDEPAEGSGTRKRPRRAQGGTGARSSAMASVSA